MSLSSGARLGAYEVRDLIGAGGMGEVYRGHDSRLNRAVALKILPEVFAADTDRLARFRREAQLLASLNHSNIAAIFGFEESSGVQALVLELVEGPTLAERLTEGPIALDEALPMARQIVDALEAAHAQAIVHRDLKPANIKLRPDGMVKVLDFGLAKAFAGEAAAPPSGRSLTITSPAVTAVGVILGTAAYMSPEQARGRAVDKRSDIWAFGGVLYEMLTGKRAFDGDDVSDTLANVLKREPDWSALPAGIPENVRRVLRRCLEKDPRKRIHDIADVRIELEDREAPTSAMAPPATRGLTRERAAWALLAAALATGLAYVLLKAPEPARVVRFLVDPPENASFGSSSGFGRLDAGETGSALSPDGIQLAFVAEQSGRTLLWVRRLDQFQARPLVGTDDAMMPFWSPDGRTIGFFAAGRLKRIDATEGSVQTICDVPGAPRGASWGSRDVIVFGSGAPPRLAQVPARGGVATPIPVAGAIFPRWPSFLPNGRRFLYIDRSESSASIMVGSTDPDVEPRRIVSAESNAAFVAPDLLVFARAGALLQQTFDLQRLEATGEATTIVDQIVYSPGLGRADFSVSQSGVMAFRSMSRESNQFAWFDRAGKMLETVGSPGNFRTPDLSPDGTRLAYTDVNQRDIWIFDLVRRTSSRFTANPGTETAPAWFPDGSKIAYRSDQGGLFEKDAGGTGTERLLLKENVNGPSQVSPDGQLILYFRVMGGDTQDIVVLPTAGDGAPRPIVQSAFADVEPQLSPNMRWLAYASSETGANEVYVQPFPPTGTRWKISNSGGRQPLWRADGKELFFVADDRKFYAVDITDMKGSFDYGTPRFLFEMRANVFNALKSYIPSRDGQRFLVNMLLGSDDAPISVVHNWRAGLGR
jgi:Tol biopolymer transport system component